MTVCLHSGTYGYRRDRQLPAMLNSAKKLGWAPSLRRVLGARAIWNWMTSTSVVEVDVWFTCGKVSRATHGVYDKRAAQTKTPALLAAPGSVACSTRSRRVRGTLGSLPREQAILARYGEAFLDAHSRFWTLATACRTTRNLGLGHLARRDKRADAAFRQTVADGAHAPASLCAFGSERAAIVEIVSGTCVSHLGADGGGL